MRPRADERIRDLQPREEAGALHADVERVSRLEPELLREEAAVSREVMVGRHRGEDDEIQVAGFHARVV